MILKVAVNNTPNHINDCHEGIHSVVAMDRKLFYSIEKLHEVSPGVNNIAVLNEYTSEYKENSANKHTIGCLGDASMDN